MDNSVDFRGNTVTLMKHVTLLGTLYLLWKISKKVERRFQSDPLFVKRPTRGAYNSLVEELSDAQFMEYTRMTKNQFMYILELVRPYLTRQTTRMREPIPPEERLMVTLRHLATGESQHSLSFQYRMGRSTVSDTIRATCQVLWDVLSPIFLPSPTKETFQQSANRFCQLWNFPNCIGSVDGKHVRIMCPGRSGSEFFNYKNFFSVVLLGMCDADYRFIVIDVGAPGRVGDSALFPETGFGHDFLDGKIELPDPSPLPDTRIVVPHFIVADDAFPLKKNIMKPYSGNHLDYEKRVFNYRLSRARRVIENTFGILVARWRILKSEMNASVETINLIVKATCCLHNYLRTESMRAATPYCPSGFADREDRLTHVVIPGEWRSLIVDNLLQNRPGRSSNAHTRQASLIRDTLAAYFCSNQGSVPWQHFSVTNTGYRPVAG